MRKKDISLTSLLLRFKKLTKNWHRSFNLIWRASPYYTILWAILLVVQGVLPGLLVYLTKYVVDSLVVAVDSRGVWEKTRPALLLILALVAVMLLTNVVQSFLEMVRAAQADIIQDYVKSLVHRKSAEVDIALFESPEYHDRLEQATSDGTSRPLSLLESIGGVVQNTITLLVMAALLIQYSIWLPVALLLSTLPAFIIVFRFDREYHKWWKATTSQRRWIQYFDVMLTNGLTAAEVRIFNLNPHFQSRYQTLSKELRSEKLSQMRRLSIAKLFSAVLSLCILGIVVGLMGWRAIYGGSLTLGDLALFYQAFNRGQGLVSTLFGSLGQMIKNSLFLSLLFEYLDLDSKITDPEFPAETPENLKEGIRFRNVTFRYPGTDRLIFKNFSLFIPSGKSVAIVGENGSGKTTMIKLLCRFYDPESGGIEFDGVNIKKFSVREFLRLITIMFQVPLSYHATVSETIAFGDLDISASTAEIENAAKSAGAHDFISRLPKKYDALLGKIHASGVELSGGEWQRLALARAYFRQAPIVLLDEPTSFLDSWAEAHWFRLFRKLTENRTAVVITHRFSIAMRADIIFVMNKGEIVERGTHKELLNLDGLYAKSWKDQMKAAEDAKDEVDVGFEVSKEQRDVLNFT